MGNPRFNVSGLTMRRPVPASRVLRGWENDSRQERRITTNSSVGGGLSMGFAR